MASPQVANGSEYLALITTEEFLRNLGDSEVSNLDKCVVINLVMVHAR